jgi:hypothetical protein
MKKHSKLVMWVLVSIVTIFIYAHFVHWFQKRYIPPEDIKNVADVLEWTGRPWWVVRYSSPTATYYELGMKVPALTLLVILSSAAPSYTVDENGRFIGWSPDSGDVHTPDVLRSHDLKRESIDVDKFIQQWKKNTEPSGAANRRERAPAAG